MVMARESFLATIRKIFTNTKSQNTPQPFLGKLNLSLIEDGSLFLIAMRDAGRYFVQGWCKT
jgi:hypothetical protein